MVFFKKKRSMPMSEFCLGLTCTWAAIVRSYIDDISSKRLFVDFPNEDLVKEEIIYLHYVILDYSAFLVLDAAVNDVIFSYFLRYVEDVLDSLDVFIDMDNLEKKIEPYSRTINEYDEGSGKGISHHLAEVFCQRCDASNPSYILGVQPVIHDLLSASVDMFYDIKASLASGLISEG